jgi:hypothetical protein
MTTQTKINKRKRAQATATATANKTVGQAPARKADTTSNEQTAVPSPAGPVTEIAARIDVGLGNALFIRGQGDGLSWEKGTPMACADASTWIWSTQKAKDKIVFKLLLNDQIWTTGADLAVEAGRRAEIVPSF